MITNQLEAARTLIAMIVSTAILMMIAFLQEAIGHLDPALTSLLLLLAVGSLAVAIGRPRTTVDHYWRQAATLTGASLLLLAGAVSGSLVG